MSWLDDFLLAIRRVRDSSGQNLPQRYALKFGAGLTTTDDPTHDQIVVEVAGGGGAGTTTIQGTCDAGLLVGQSVRVSWLELGGARFDVVTSAGTVPAVGVVASKTTPTLATVALVGAVDVLFALPTIGGALWLGADGWPAAAPPASGLAQRIGWAVGPNRIVVQPGDAVGLA